MRVIFGQSSAAEEHHWNLVQNNGIYPFLRTFQDYLLNTLSNMIQAKEQPR